MIIRRLLLATDLSPHADRAMERAVQLAGQFDAEIAAVCAIDGNDAPTRLDAVSQDIERHFATIPAAKCLSPMPIATKGPVEEAIAVLLTEWQPDLVIIGAHRIETPADLFAVSTIERVALRCDVPILVVRNRAFGPYDSLMAAMDFERPSRLALECALGFGMRNLHLLNAIDLPIGAAVADTAGVSARTLPKELTQATAGLNFDKFQVSWSIRTGRPQDVIVAAAHELRPDIMVLGTSGRTGLGRMVIGSVAHEVLEHLPCDALLRRPSQ